jgi:hypothetical protein
MPAMKGSGVRKQRGIRFADDEWDAIIRGARDAGVSVPDWIMRWVPRPPDADPEPSLMDVMSEGQVVAAVEVAPRGHEQSVPLDTIVGPVRVNPDPPAVTNPVRHLHRFKDTGRVLRYERGKAVPERQCECGVTAP